MCTLIDLCIVSRVFCFKSTQGIFYTINLWSAGFVMHPTYTSWNVSDQKTCERFHNTKADQPMANGFKLLVQLQYSAGDADKKSY